MNKIQLIDSELMKCMLEMSKLSSKYVNKNEYSSSHTKLRATPLGTASSEWVEKRDQWGREKKSPTLVELYSYHIKFPSPDVVIDYMQRLFNGSDVYRHAVFNFLGENVNFSIWQIFNWFFVINQMNGTFLTLDEYASPENNFLDLGFVERSQTCCQFYLEMKFGKHIIFLTWIRSSEFVLDVIFSSKDDFCTSKLPFDDLKKKCE
jgi:hypothetical protein